METKLEWTDATTYSQGQKDRKQTAWSLKLPSLRIWIGTGHKYYPNEFIMHCHELGFDTYQMNLPADTPIKKVKYEALSRCRHRVNNFYIQLNTAINESTTTDNPANYL